MAEETPVIRKLFLNPDFVESSGFNEAVAAAGSGETTPNTDIEDLKTQLTALTARVTALESAGA